MSRTDGTQAGVLGAGIAGPTTALVLRADAATIVDRARDPAPDRDQQPASMTCSRRPA